MRNHTRNALGSIAILMGLSTPLKVWAGTTTLTFDEFPNQTPITTQYQSIGVTVSGATTLNAAVSPWPANTPSYLVYSQPGLMTFTLDPTIIGPIQTVSAYVSGTSSVGIYAYDAAGLLVGQAATPGATDNALLTVTSSGNPIKTVTIHDGGSNFAIDTLKFATATTIPFSNFAPSLAIVLGAKPSTDSFAFSTPLTLSAGASPFNRATDVVTLKIDNLTTNIPAGSFKPNGFGGFVYTRKVDGVYVAANIQPLSPSKYQVTIGATGLSLTGLSNPVPVTLTMGMNTGDRSVTATFVRPRGR